MTSSPPSDGRGGRGSAKVAPEDDDDGEYILPKADPHSVIWLFLAPVATSRSYVNKISANMVAFKHDAKMQMRCCLDLTNILRYDRWLALAASAHIPEKVLAALDLHDDDEVLVREALSCVRRMIRTENIAEIVRKTKGRDVMGKIRDANRDDEFISADVAAALESLERLGTSFAKGTIATALASARERGSLDATKTILVAMEEHSEKSAVQVCAVEALAALLALPNGTEHLTSIRDGIPRFEAVLEEHKRDESLMVKLLLLIESVARSGDSARADIGRSTIIIFAVDALVAYPKSAHVPQSALWLVDQITATPDNFHRFLACGGDIKLAQLREHVEQESMRVIVPLHINTRLTEHK